MDRVLGLGAIGEIDGRRVDWVDRVGISKIWVPIGTTKPPKHQRIVMLMKESHT